MHGFANEEHPHSHLLCWNKKQTLYDMQVNNLLTTHCCRNELRANFLSFRIFFYTLFFYFFVFSLSLALLSLLFSFTKKKTMARLLGFLDLKKQSQVKSYLFFPCLPADCLYECACVRVRVAALPSL